MAINNYIKRLEADRRALECQLIDVRNELTELLTYLNSSKFQGDGNDYVHVSTDIFPKLAELRTKSHPITK
jgi:hypothetical protein